MKHESVCRRTVIVNLKEGLHLRPYSLIARSAAQFVCDVSIRNGDLTADAKSVLELMTLNAGLGTELILEASGDGAAEVVVALARLFESNFEEEESVDR